MLKGLIRLAPCAAVLFSLIPSVHADDGRRVFTGTLGKMPIVVELNITQQDEVTGRYFYEKYHRDLPLSGALQNSTLTLTEGNNRYGDDKPLSTLELEETGSGWQGEWKSPQGKKLPVKLIEARLTAPTSSTLPFIAALPYSEPYEYLRLQGLKLKPAKKENFMGYHLQWWTEPETKISLFSVESGLSKDDQQRVNQQLLGRLWNEVISYHGCQLQGGENVEFMQQAQPKMISPAVVSLNISTSYYCGGAHPDFGDSPLNIDVKTGHPLSLEDVLWVGEGNPLLHAERDSLGDEPLSKDESNARYQYVSKELVPWVIKQFTALYPTEMKTPTGDDDCNFQDESIWGTSPWYFTEKGLYLGAYFARVQRSCDRPDWSILPYSLVKQHPGAVKLQLPQG
ncbi:hypothetical protein EVS84_01995 [Pseudomonas koreensis]|uniref:DUF3298 domain-containing protein n=2 Tax=Pseudomonas TaxID=286 RepID=A0A4Q4L9G6_9PSED|nr:MULTISPECIES: hypothetical protein [Pseudomonas]MDM8190460.1 hypothetical protein [Pseudomonas fluorescens]MDP8571705.1 hypothetical protein [Pseudomonas iranensis]RYM44536.1 hypothetical protein EVS84_01995 [Pseudomonas koreensis]